MHENLESKATNRMLEISKRIILLLSVDIPKILFFTK